MTRSETLLDGPRPKPLTQQRNPAALSYTRAPMLPAARHYSALSQPCITLISETIPHIVSPKVFMLSMLRAGTADGQAASLTSDGSG
ncbi:hypothetical protein DC429_11980 [Arthrobacter sp. TPD3018]|nr:hypothetical protein DC425_14015 [Sphingomonas sp. TPD3009]PVE56048.1 hypothetical protein DC429_11980 [Arthrobacter sp. TPD3018]PVE81646.1 hypothetical protein DC431_13350 [Sphingomonas melonis]